MHAYCLFLLLKFYDNLQVPLFAFFSSNTTTFCFFPMLALPQCLLHLFHFSILTLALQLSFCGRICPYTTRYLEKQLTFFMQVNVLVWHVDYDPPPASTRFSLLSGSVSKVKVLFLTSHVFHCLITFIIDLVVIMVLYQGLGSLFFKKVQ